MDCVETAEARFHYLAAVCHLAATDYPRAIEACRRAQPTADAALAVECEYVAGWAHLERGDETAAAVSFENVGRCSTSPSAELARALAARLALGREDYYSATELWKAIEPQRRTEWGLEEPLRQTVFLSALTALHAGQFAEAGEKFREAGQLGLRDRRMGELLVLSLVKAGQRLLYQATAESASYELLESD
jgi:hypothetical protein